MSLSRVIHKRPILSLWDIGTDNMQTDGVVLVKVFIDEARRLPRPGCYWLMTSQCNDRPKRLVFFR